MKRVGQIVVFTMIALVLSTSLGLGLPGLAQKASAAGCTGPSIMFGRWKWCGYFYNRFFDNGPSVRVQPDGFNGVPGYVNTGQEFADMVVNDYFSGDQQLYTEGSFTMRVMTGQSLPTPPLPYHSSKNVSNALIQDFRDRIKGYTNLGENGSQSFGTNGRIDWFYSDLEYCGEFNSYYQVPHWDIAPFIINGSNTPGCSTNATRSDFIVFRDNAGNPIVTIRRLCMNPFGTIGALSSHVPDYNLNPSVTASIGGQPVADGAEVGQTIHFDYSVNNSGNDPSPNVNCNIFTNTFTGNFVPATPSTSGGAGPGTGCPRAFPGNANTPVAAENVPVVTDNQTICRSFQVDPTSVTTGPRTVEQCVRVVKHPYLRIYGGDISAGNGFTTSPGACTPNTGSAIVSWNKGAGGAYGGAGVQYAAAALNIITNFSTTLGNGGGSAPVPNGLAFTNNTATPGSFGSLPCVKDFYGTGSSNVLPSTNLTSLGGQNTYGAIGPIAISGNINPNQRTVIYVNGDVLINGNISFPGGWSVASMPMFELVAKGNIYISNAVTQLDGVFVAQPNGAAGGTIYTCAHPALPGVGYTADDTLSGNCHNGLTINGAFVAKQVQFLRTRGTLYQSNAAEPSTSANIAEVFRFSPALWMAQPPNQTNGVLEYDAIASLPPIL
jgi:hypothetical protein